MGEENKTDILGWDDKENWDWMGLAIALGGYGNMGILEYWPSEQIPLESMGGGVGRDTVGERKALKIIEFSHSIFKENVILILIVM